MQAGTLGFVPMPVSQGLNTLCAQKVLELILSLKGYYIKARWSGFLIRGALFPLYTVDGLRSL